MRANEFYLIEKRLGPSGTSTASIPKYMPIIISLIANAEKPGAAPVSVTKGASEFDYVPTPGVANELSAYWNKIKNDKSSWKSAFNFKLNGTVNGEPDNTFTVGHLTKGPVSGGSSGKGYNLGNATEGILASALYLKLKFNKPVSVKYLINFMSKSLPGLNGKVHSPGSENTAYSVPNAIQDKIFLAVGLSQNNYDAFINPQNYQPVQLKKTTKDSELMNQVISTVNYVNANIDLRTIQEELIINGVIDRITVRAAGTDDEKGTKVDVDVIYTSPEIPAGDDGTPAQPAKQDSVTFERSVKAADVDQFDQKSTGGAGRDAVSLPDEEGIPKPYGGEYTKKTFGELSANKQRTFIANARWKLQKQFWENLIPDAVSDTGFMGEGKRFKEIWRWSMEDDTNDWITAFDTSYKNAAQQLSKILRGDSKEKKFVKSFFNELAQRAGRTKSGRGYARTTEFSKGKYEELDFTKLNDYIEDADLKAVYIQDKAHPEVHIIAGSAGGKDRVSWDANDKFLTVRLYVQEKKLSNLIEKGPLLRKWAFLAAGDKKGNLLDAMGDKITATPAGDAPAEEF